MNRILLIIQREYLSRVKKRSFLIMTIVGPILLSAIGILPAYFASMPEPDRTVMVLDKADILDRDKGSDRISLKYIGPPAEYTIEEAKEQFMLTEDYALVYIPTGSGWDPDFISQNIVIYGKEEVSLGIKSFIEDLIRSKIEDLKLRNQGVDPEVIAQVRTRVKAKSINIEESGIEEESVVEGKMVIGFVFAFFMYFFIFIFGSQVMNGVMEEKSNRVVEVIISSVRPFQLMMGKILGSGLVGLTQFLIWMALSFVLYSAFTGIFLADKMDAIQTMAEQSAGAENVDQLKTDGLNSVMTFLDTLNIPVLIGSFIFYFLGGFFLYAAMFAAIGSAVENQAEAQQFLFPVTIPIILSIVIAMKVAEDPNGQLGFWFSMIPFTSPIVMVTRIPFGVPYWQLALSMVLLIGGFIGTTWVASRIYRVGILMYGKKITWGELWKWMKYGG